MSFHRVVFVALATLFTVGMTSMASAGCCDWGYAAPVAYAEVAPVGYGGYGGYGGCGGCGAPTAAVVYACRSCRRRLPSTPAAAAALGAARRTGAMAAVAAATAGRLPNTCGNCGSVGWGGGWRQLRLGRRSGALQRLRGVSPLYVVNQGPIYSGPGLMQPYATYSPDTAYAPAANYPYVPGYGYGPAPVPPPYYSHLYYHPHYAYRAPMYAHPRYYGGALSRQLVVVRSVGTADCAQAIDQDLRRPARCGPLFFPRVIRKSGSRFSDKITRNEEQDHAIKPSRAKRCKARAPRRSRR